MGFKHKFDSKEVITDISLERFNRYKDRISACFDAYYKRGYVREREAGKWLEHRVKFLTTNTRLEFSKELAHTGIYFNNSILNLPSARLKGLDIFLQSKAADPLHSEPHRIKLHAKLQQLSFHKGFCNKTYSSYTSSKGGLRASMLKEITGVWKYD